MKINSINANADVHVKKILLDRKPGKRFLLIQQHMDYCVRLITAISFDNKNKIFKPDQKLDHISGKQF